MSNHSPLNPEAPNPFGALEDKSLDLPDVEVKADAPAEKATVTVPVKMLHHSADGDRQLLPGHKYDVPRALAQTLVAAKRAVRL